MIHNTMIQKSGLKVSGSENVEVLAGGNIQIGDIVYSINPDTDMSIDWGNTSSVNVIAFSPDGDLLAIGGEYGKLKIFSVNGTKLTYLRDISAGYSIYTAVFFKVDSLLGLIIGGHFDNFIKYYSIDGTTFTETTNRFSDYPEGIVHKIIALNNTEILVCGEVFKSNKYFGYAKQYTLIGKTFRYQVDLYSDNSGTEFDGIVSSGAVSNDNKWLALGGRFTGRAKLYSVDYDETFGDTITYHSDIYSDASGSPILQYTANAVSFSPDSNMLVVGTGYPDSMGVDGTLNVYTMSESGATFKGNLTNVTGIVNSIQFSKDNKVLFVGGYFEGGMNIYSISDNGEITFVKTLYGSVERIVKTIAINPSGDLLFLGGVLPGRSAAYFINGTDLSLVAETVYPISESIYVVDNEYTYLSVAKSNADEGKKVKVCRISKLSFQ